MAYIIVAISYDVDALAVYFIVRLCNIFPCFHSSTVAGTGKFLTASILTKDIIKQWWYVSSEEVSCCFACWQ
jgi:hypothetical protein